MQLGTIPDTMGINLNSVEGVSWTRQFDHQLVSVTIHFKPVPANHPDYERVKQINHELAESLEGQHHPDPDSVLVDCKIDELNKLARAFADEQALGFAKWAIERGYFRRMGGWYTYDSKGPHTDFELLTRYHESQKP